MLENFIMQVRRPKGVLDERVAFVSPAAQGSAAACIYIKQYADWNRLCVSLKCYPTTPNKKYLRDRIFSQTQLFTSHVFNGLLDYSKVQWNPAYRGSRMEICYFSIKINPAYRGGIRVSGHLE